MYAKPKSRFSTYTAIAGVAALLFASWYFISGDDEPVKDESVRALPEPQLLDVPMVRPKDDNEQDSDTDSQPIVTTTTAPPPQLVDIHDFPPERLGPTRYAATVFNKSVLLNDYRKHMGLFWALNHCERRGIGNGPRWNLREDYIGVYPARTRRYGDQYATRLTLNKLQPESVLFVVDTSGVTPTPLQAERSIDPDDPAGLEYPFRGLSLEEATVMQVFAESGGSVIAEFNTFAYPTSRDVRARMEKLFGVRWQSWIGSYFQDLSSEEVPAVLRDLWAKRSQRPWRYAGPGILFANYRNGLVIVLEIGTHLESDGLKITNLMPNDPLMLHVDASTVYGGRFDIVEAQEGTDVLAEFRLSLTPEGRTLADQAQIPVRFPAITRASSKPLLTYLAGDFAERSFLDPSRMPNNAQMVADRENAKSRQIRSDAPFFWNVYLPFVQSALHSVGTLRSDAGERELAKPTGPPPQFINLATNETMEPQIISIPRPIPRVRSIAIFDKTTPDTSFLEHRGLIWTLNYLGLSSPNGDPFDAATDYIGYYPQVAKSVDNINQTYAKFSEEHVAHTKLLYIADTYGVEVSALPDQFQGLNQRHLGGLTRDDVNVVRRFLSTGGNLIAEFNTFGSPTENSVSKEMQDVMGVNWSGWVGRYFLELDEESERRDAPEWVYRGWRAKNFGTWPYKGPGYVMFHVDGRIEIIPEQDHVRPNGFSIYVERADDPLMQGVGTRVPYGLWFDILDANDDHDILASYRFNLLPEGVDVFRNAGIPDTFPAVVRTSKTPLRLYFCGNYAYYGFTAEMPSGGDALYTEMVARKALGVRTQDAFYTDFYIPLMQNVLQLNLERR